MHDPKLDRRVQRTQQLLQDALIGLILERGYEAITVQDILDRANLGRSTFYTHYRDKEDLLLSGFQHLFDAFQEEFLQLSEPGTDPAQGARKLSLFFFRHAGSHRNLYQAMIGEQGGRVILDHAQKKLMQLIRNHLADQFPDRKDDLLIDALAHYIATSYLSVLTWWLDHKMPYTAEQMDALYQRLVFPGMREVLASSTKEMG